MGLQWDGMAEFKAALHNLPDDLAQDSSVVVLAHAEEAKRLVPTNYPTGPTGNLKRGVTLERNVTRVAASAIVRSRARHAAIFENGTTRRATTAGYNRGTMPQAPVEQRMIPVVIRLRRRMVEALIALVERAGFTVSQAA